MYAQLYMDSNLHLELNALYIIMRMTRAVLDDVFVDSRSFTIKLSRIIEGWKSYIISRIIRIVMINGFFLRNEIRETAIFVNESKFSYIQENTSKLFILLGNITFYRYIIKIRELSIYCI